MNLTKQIEEILKKHFDKARNTAYQMEVTIAVADLKRLIKEVGEKVIAVKTEFDWENPETTPFGVGYLRFQQRAKLKELLK